MDLGMIIAKFIIVGVLNSILLYYVTNYRIYVEQDTSIRKSLLVGFSIAIMITIIEILTSNLFIIIIADIVVTLVFIKLVYGMTEGVISNYILIYLKTNLVMIIMNTIASAIFLVAR